MRALMQYLIRSGIEINVERREETWILPDPQGQPTRFVVLYHVTARLSSWPEHEVVTGRFSTQHLAQAWISMLTPSILARFRPSRDYRSPQDTSQWSWWLSLAMPLEGTEGDASHAIIPSVWGVKIHWGLDERWGIMLDTLPRSSTSHPRIMMWGDTCRQLITMCDYGAQIDELDRWRSTPSTADVQSHDSSRVWQHTLRTMLDSAVRAASVMSQQVEETIVFGGLVSEKIRSMQRAQWPRTGGSGFIVLINGHRYQFVDHYASVCSSDPFIVRSDDWRITITEPRDYSKGSLPVGPWMTDFPHCALPYNVQVSKKGRSVRAFVSSFKDAIAIAIWSPPDILDMLSTSRFSDGSDNQRWSEWIQRSHSVVATSETLQAVSPPVLIAYRHQWYVAMKVSMTTEQSLILFQGSSFHDVIAAIQREFMLQRTSDCTDNQ